MLDLEWWMGHVLYLEVVQGVPQVELVCLVPPSEVGPLVVQAPSELVPPSEVGPLVVWAPSEFGQPPQLVALVQVVEVELGSAPLVLWWELQWVGALHMLRKCQIILLVHYK
jgi:hypothetical protein